jgi:hypothetical protein
MNNLAPLSEHYHEQPVPVRLVEKHEALLAFRMSWIVGDATEGISKHRRRFLKCDPVLEAIGRCLRAVPLDPQRFGQLFGLMAARCSWRT